MSSRWYGSKYRGSGERCSSRVRASGSAQTHTKPHRRSQRSSPSLRTGASSEVRPKSSGASTHAHEPAQAVGVPPPAMERTGDLVVGERPAPVRESSTAVPTRVVIGADLVGP